MKLDLTRVLEIFSRTIDISTTVDRSKISFNKVDLTYPYVHQFKVAHFSVHLGQELGMSDNELEDIFMLGLYHDVGFISSEIVKYYYHENRIIDYEAILGHCLIGEKLVSTLPFHTDVKNVIAYHHENFDGSGFFSISGENIPLYSRILVIANEIDLNFDLNNNQVKLDQIINYLFKGSGKIFDPTLVEPAIKVLKAHLGANYDIRCDDIPFHSNEYSWEQLKSLVKTLMLIIDNKSTFTYKHSSTITKYVNILTKYYHFNKIRFQKLEIAANLHDIGKLFISQRILEKPGKLNAKDMLAIKEHPLNGEKMLLQIKGFDDIARWVGQHHEKLNGTGYPKGLHSKEIDFESQILAVCDIFTALMEDRPYRKAFEFINAKKIIFNMVENGELNKDIVNDLLNNIQII